MKNKKGMILSDVLISVTVFLIMSLSIFNIISNERQFLNMQKDIEEKSKILKLLKNELRYNTSYYLLQDYVNKEVFIDSKNMNFEDIKNCNEITDLFHNLGEEDSLKLSFKEEFNEKTSSKLIYVNYEINVLKGKLNGNWVKG